MNNKYEAMCIINPNLSEEERKGLFAQIGEVVSKNNGNISSASVWGEKRKLYFPLKKHREGIYYLINFSAPPPAVKDIRHAYKLNENILRVLLTKVE